MRPYAIRLLTLAVSAAVVVALLTATDVAASSRHIRKHHGWSESWASGEVRPVAHSYSPGSVCPGISRGIDCRIWPPPFDEDADRNSGDGGGG